MGKRRRGESCGACYITAHGTSSSALVWGRPSERAGCCSLTAGSSSLARRGGPCQRAFHRAGCCSLTAGRQGTLSLLATLEQVQARSEEHTSELQSHSDLVCRLLLEKKKRHNYNKLTPHAAT